MHRYFFYLLFLWLCSCDSGYDKVLSLSGANRNEIRRIIDYIDRDTCELKKASADFLLKHMPIHYVTPLQDEKGYDSICNLMEFALSFCDHKLPKSRKEIIDSLVVDLPIGPGYSVQPDCRCVTAEYFIHDLEMAHHQYVKCPFKDSIRLEQYMEFILPYRALDGMCLHDWRSYLFKTYCHRLNSVKDLPIKTVVDSILDTGKLIEYGYDYVHKLAYRKILEYEVSENGSCQVRAQYNRMLMAAYGIPCAIDYVPVWGNINGRHVWSCILTKNESLPFDPFPYPQKWNLKASYNNVNYDDDYGKYRLPKVFRECYSQNDLPIHKDKGLKIPNGLLKRNFMDVSEEYFQPVDVIIELEEAIPSVINYLYICAYYKGEWEPVWFGKRDGNRVVFEKMGHDIIYTVGYYEEGMIKIVGHPFYVNEDGIAESVIPDFNIKRTISFNRTQRTKPKDIYKKNTLFGCQLQATNDESWQKFDTLATITYPIQSRVNTMVIDSEECYRYIRLWFPRDTVCMSEISIETTPGYDFKGYRHTTIKNEEAIGQLFNGSVSDYLHLYKKGRSSGDNFIEWNLDRNVKINSFSFCPVEQSCLDDNTQYELYHWYRGGWHLLGETSCVNLDDGNKVLVYDDVPDGALLAVRFVQDKIYWSRIFKYEDGRQIWY